MKYFGLAIAGLMVFGAILTAGPIWTFIDIPSILMVLGMTIGLTVFKYGKEGLFFWKMKSKNQKSIVANWIGKTCLHVGLFSALVGFIQIGSYMKDFSALAPSIAVAILPIFYSYIVFLFITSPYTLGENKDHLKKDSSNLKKVA